MRDSYPILLSILRAKNFNDTEWIITEAELEDLLNKAQFFTKNRSYTAKPNAADYFAYKLTPLAQRQLSG
jgi:hypothetical protein